MFTIPQSLVLNRAAIQRITGIPARRIESFEIEFDDLVCVWIKPSRTDKSPKPVHVSMAELEEEFHRFRRESSKSLVVLSSRPSLATKGAMIHRVEGHGGDVYLVEESSQHLACNCEDWHQHTTVCKHGWAVLNAYGASSLFELRRDRSETEHEAMAAIARRYSRPAPKTFKGVAID